MRQTFFSWLYFLSDERRLNHAASEHGMWTVLRPRPGGGGDTWSYLPSKTRRIHGAGETRLRAQAAVASSAEEAEVERQARAIDVSAKGAHLRAGKKGR